MRLRNMLKICLVFWKSEPQYAYKRYAYKKKTCMSPMSSSERFSIALSLLIKLRPPQAFIRGSHGCVFPWK